MPVSIGVQLGYHEVTALLGKGGMGEVYRARDTKLKRDVAIKILPDEFSRDPDRVSRFQREAEVLASLNHPNIAAIHSLEEAAGTRFLVLELVEGETLADKLKRGPFSIDEALAIAKNICEALEAAHEKNVVHRDLKPANVKITAEGKVKVLDLGLAKAMETWVGFLSLDDRTLKRMAVTGGAATTICKSDGYNASWSGDQIVFSDENKGIMRCSADGGDPEVLVPIKPPDAGDSPQILDDGRYVLFSLATGSGADRWDKGPQIVLQSLVTGQRKVLVRGGHTGRYVPTGHLVYAFAGTLLAVPFNLKTHQVEGVPVPVVEGVTRATGPFSGAANFDISSDGSLVYIPGAASGLSAQSTLALVDRRSGQVQPLPLPPQPYYTSGGNVPLWSPESNSSIRQAAAALPLISALNPDSAWGKPCRLRPRGQRWPDLCRAETTTSPLTVNSSSSLCLRLLLKVSRGKRSRSTSC